MEQQLIVPYRPHSTCSSNLNRSLRKTFCRGVSHELLYVLEELPFYHSSPSKQLAWAVSTSRAQIRRYRAAFQYLAFGFYQQLKEESGFSWNHHSLFLTYFMEGLCHKFLFQLSSRKWTFLPTNPSASTFMKLRIHNLSCFLFSFGFLSSEPKLVLHYNNSRLHFLVVISPFFHGD